jgi:hypothetical protein
MRRNSTTEQSQGSQGTFRFGQHPEVALTLIENHIPTLKKNELSGFFNSLLEMKVSKKEKRLDTIEVHLTPTE